MLEILSKVLELDLLVYVGAVAGLLGALYTVALLIPGKQPDKTLKMLLDLTEKLSRK